MKSQGRVDIDATRTRLEQLGFVHAAELLPQLLNTAVKDELSTHRVLDQLLEIEAERREERRVRTSLKLSGLPTGQTLAEFDFSFQPLIESGRTETLATCASIRKRERVILAGPPGVGKTHLAVALDSSLLTVILWRFSEVAAVPRAALVALSEGRTHLPQMLALIRQNTWCS